MTKSERDEITIVVRVVGLAEERDERVAAGRAVSLGCAHTRIRPHISGVEHYIVLFITREIFVLLTVELHTEQEIGTVLIDIQVIGDDSVPHPLEPVLLLCFNTVLIVSHRSLCYRIGEDTLFLLSIVDTGCGAYVQSLIRCYVEESVTEQAPVGVTVVAVSLKTCQRVLTVGIAAHRTCELAIGRIDRQRGVELQHVLEEAAGGCHLRGAVESEVLTDRHIVANDLIVGVDTSREAVEVRGLDDTIVLIVAQREIAATFLTAVRHCQVVALYQTRTRGGTVPVGIGCRHLAVRV